MILRSKYSMGIKCADWIKNEPPEAVNNDKCCFMMPSPVVLTPGVILSCTKKME